MTIEENPEASPLHLLLGRFEPRFLGHRMRIQVDYLVRLFGRGLGGFHFENIEPLFPLLDWVLKLSGLRQRAVRNVLSHEVRREVFVLDSLPRAFDGLRVLHLSDLHLDCREAGIDGLGRPFCELIRSLSFDLCVITGDFRYKTHGAYQTVAEEMALLMPALSCRHGVFGVLGNHDFIEQVPYLEQLGVRMLVNEAAAVEREGQTLWLVGVDDPHFYGTHNLAQALARVPVDAFQIGLFHSPELTQQAEQLGIALYLCGHTHGGQICLPGGLPLYLDARCPRRLARGRWQLSQMQGYTSTGTGCSGLPVRLNCPPEVAIHELRRGSDEQI